MPIGVFPAFGDRGVRSLQVQAFLGSLIDRITDFALIAPVGISAFQATLFGSPKAGKIPTPLTLDTFIQTAVFANSNMTFARNDIDVSLSWLS